MEEGQVIACVLVALLLEEDGKRKRGKTRKWIKNRTQKGFYANIVKKLRLEDTGAYKEMTRMNYNTFLTILSFIEPYISPQDTYFRTKTIKGDERLTIATYVFWPLKKHFVPFTFNFELDITQYLILFISNRSHSQVCW